MEKSIKIIIADDHQVLREGLIALFNNVAEIDVVSTASNGNELANGFKKHEPDLILVDIKMPEINGLDSVKLLKRHYPGVKALFLSMYDGDEYAYKVARSGGSGLINKNTSKNEIITAIKTVANGDTYFTGKWSGNSVRNVIRRYKKEKSDTPKASVNFNFREKQILYLLNFNLTSQQMSEKMCIAKKTIDYYRVQLKKKLKLPTNSQLIKYAQDHKNKYKFSMEE